MSSPHRELLVVITRLSATSRSPEDEYTSSWHLPELPNSDAGTIDDLGFWVSSKDRLRILVVVHGHRQLFGAEMGSFSERLAGILGVARSDACQGIGPFDFSWVFAHGNIPELSDVLDSEASLSLNVSALEATLPSSKKKSYSTKGQGDVAVVLPRALRNAGVSDALVAMVEDQLRIEAPVDRAVREMQHVILGIRLLMASLRTTQGEKRTETLEKLRAGSSSLERLFKERAVQVAVVEEVSRGFTTIEKFLGPIADDVKENLKNEGVAFPDCEEMPRTALVSLLRSGRLPPQEVVGLDECLCALSARLEALIVAARLVDAKKRRRASVAEATP